MHKFFAKTQFLGKKVLFLPECHSTNDFAAHLLKESRPIEGTTIITPHQSQGRGQRGNTWESEPHKNATFSIILQPTIVPAHQPFQLHIITTLAIHAVLFPLLGKGLKIKWPNDILYHDKKLGGILIENSLKGQKIESSIVGIGLNVNQAHFDLVTATSLLEITGREMEVNALIEQILIALEQKYMQLKNGHLADMEAQYLRRLYRYGEKAMFKSTDEPFTGVIRGINKQGCLQIESSGEVHEFGFKEVSFI